jgi:hypothetical protein
MSRLTTPELHGPAITAPRKYWRCAAEQGALGRRTRYRRKRPSQPCGKALVIGRPQAVSVVFYPM